MLKCTKEVRISLPNPEIRMQRVDAYSGKKTYLNISGSLSVGITFGLGNGGCKKTPTKASTLLQVSH